MKIRIFYICIIMLALFSHVEFLHAQINGNGWNYPGSPEVNPQPGPPIQQMHSNPMVPSRQGEMSNSSMYSSPYSPVSGQHFSGEHSSLMQESGGRQFGLDQTWDWHILPPDIVYKAYMAGPRESRFYSVMNHDKEFGWLWDVALGGRAAILRYGSKGVSPPEGWELDIEGAVFPRLSIDENRDLKSADFRFGVPLTYSSGNYAWKLGYYHISSHVGDEYWEKNPGFARRNYVRETIVLGNAWYPTDNIRLYGEMGYSFMNRGGSKPFELQYGAEFSPVMNAGIRGTPFAAINAYHKQDQDWIPTLNAQLGWQWKGSEFDKIFRVGLSYQTGPTTQYQFLGDNEDLLGFGMWYDF